MISCAIGLSFNVYKWTCSFSVSNVDLFLFVLPLSAAAAAAVALGEFTYWRWHCISRPWSRETRR